MAESDVDRNIERAFDLAREVVAKPGSFPDEFVAFHLGDEIILKILTKERLKLLRTVRDEGPFESIADLARAVDRDPSRVSRDLTWLVEADLVRLERHGRSKEVQSTDRKILLA